MSESISPILNKVGQFISSNVVSNIIGSPKSTIDLEKIMNEGKILLLNLSQGKLGEDNSSLLGAMIITKLQLAAMNRVDLPRNKEKISICMSMSFRILPPILLSKFCPKPENIIWI